VSKEFKRGDVVKYSGGPTAICKLLAPHAGGWHAVQCLGGLIFISIGYPNFYDVHHATVEEIQEGMKSSFWRLDEAWAGWSRR